MISSLKPSSKPWLYRSLYSGSIVPRLLTALQSLQSLALLSDSVELRVIDDASADIVLVQSAHPTPSFGQEGLFHIGFKDSPYLIVRVDHRSSMSLSTSYGVPVRAALYRHRHSADNMVLKFLSCFVWS